METRGFRRIFSFSGQALFNHLDHIAGFVLERLSQREFEFICILGLCKIEACDFFVFWVSARLKLVNMAGESSSNLPAGWVQGTERKEDGTKVKYFVHLGRGVRVNSVEDMLHYKNSESGENNPKQTGGRTKVSHQFCSRCKEVGHDIFLCPLAQQAAITKPTARSLSGRVTVARTRKSPRCSKCGKIGHNCRSCHQPPKSPESPKPM
ncbi:uncharacterized protein LOC117619608 [Prunus dulcis]|uniref:uncharacterized protein LOC117619608 n=1 Tax=Prunus dulcis TaxID=3755 RepID=UPI0014822906|nr:uncharacterized protein LOC117619608 [Prunus dulcis]